MQIQTSPDSKVQDQIKEIFHRQIAHSPIVARTTHKERIAKLKSLKKILLEKKEDIRKALYDDFKKHPSEVDLTEIYPVVGDIKHTVAHLKRWMKSKPVSTPMALLGSSSWIHYEPKGVVLIISPWNFPVNLTFGPLVSAIAAGNCVTIKPSENTPHASRVMGEIVAELFSPEEVVLFQGGVETAKSLLEMPFNHIFFTGAPSVGKIVMAAAAKNLASVTLELGGKCPTVVDETANLSRAAKRIAWSKCLNNGQICIAPDYIFVHESKRDQLIKLLDEQIKTLYGDKVDQSKSYCRIVNDRHFQRLQGYMDNALEGDVKIERGGRMIKDENYIEPTIVSNVDDEMDLMLHEIFGPILPIYSYSSLEDVIARINEKEKPLAMYIYSRSKKNIRTLINETRAGGTCINHSTIHFFNNNLPFGGVNNSGIGKSHGEWGFRAFSNERGVLKQWSPISAIEWMTPPYNSAKQKLIDLSIKYF